MQHIKMVLEQEILVDAEEFAKGYKEYKAICVEENNHIEPLDEWLENALAEKYNFSLWKVEIVNYENILKKVQKILDN